MRAFKTFEVSKRLARKTGRTPTILVRRRPVLTILSASSRAPAVSMRALNRKVATVDRLKTPRKSIHALFLDQSQRAEPLGLSGAELLETENRRSHACCGTGPPPPRPAARWTGSRLSTATSQEPRRSLARRRGRGRAAPASVSRCARSARQRAADTVTQREERRGARRRRPSGAMTRKSAVRKRAQRRLAGTRGGQDGRRWRRSTRTFSWFYCARATSE